MQPRRPRRKRAVVRSQRPWLPVAVIGGAVIVVVVLVVVLSNVFNGGSSDDSGIIASGLSHSSPQEGAVLGQRDAPVTMIEYFRFDCSHCGDFALQTAPQIEKEYVDTGELRIEERALALQGSAILDASEGALCAGEQGHYFDYYDLLFANRAQTDAYSIDMLKRYARYLKLDTGAFNTCLDSKKFEQSVIDETNQAVDGGVTGTPTFFVGATQAIEAASLPYTDFSEVPGAQPYTAFKDAIDAELAKVQ
jgi:protein-disulfide isomerase